MSSNDDPVAIPMIERKPSDLPGMDTSDLNTFTGEAVLSFHNISYRETVQSGFPFRKKTCVIERLSNIKSKELRKRTSIAMELVTEHPILFLDDPTTDLDLRTATDVFSVLRRMSMRGRTIIFSINQPPYSIFRCFDSLTLVASGKVMFHGPAQEALEYFTSAGYNYDSLNNPADFFLDIISGGSSAILDTEEDCHEGLPLALPISSPVSWQAGPGHIPSSKQTSTSLKQSDLSINNQALPSP
ncbi:ATP-binding cassette sub-family G member 3 [Cricetulus griseus]|uniref:ATP-binding cassette sub-family G member 3 n=1 Tax=Cricetulus griseus TaxID=10029 RepID=G3IJ95_CRIGR|nr:ATP-binding cassette sub-family G member 3 [Cricetulus griseus]